ncbi:DUF1348 family protein (plasmid) [Polymorphobacter sp. PAMC 29334]|uniref:DUF1348 family protein n=1 Tax=Polymorphobacter sp. PAMC 29334 TaxID=2862331 RepID=UPI001C77017E|nr:DUF1348 family protein [Polymorphobacter sp. PAMC 29334]
MTVHFAYEWRDAGASRFCSYGNEPWAFASHSFMRRRLAGMNQFPVGAADRLFRWTLGRRPDDHAGLRVRLRMLTGARSVVA